MEDDGLDVGREQVERGWAQVYVFDRRFRRTASYRRKRAAPRRADDGAWRKCDGDFHQPLSDAHAGSLATNRRPACA